MQLIVQAILVTFFLMAQVQSASAQEDLQKRIDQLGKRIQELESKQRQPVAEIHRDAGGAVVFLFATSVFYGRKTPNGIPGCGSSSVYSSM